MTASNPTDDARTDAETTEIIDEERRTSITATAGGILTGLLGLGAASGSAAARVPMPTFQNRKAHVAISNKQSTEIRGTYVYSFIVTNKSGNSRRIRAAGKGPRDALASQWMSGRSGSKFTLKSPEPLNRIVIY